MNYQCYLRRVVDRNEGLGAPPVVAVLARHQGLPLRLLLHEDLVDTPANTSHQSPELSNLNHDAPACLSIFYVNGRNIFHVKSRRGQSVGKKTKKWFVASNLFYW